MNLRPLCVLLLFALLGAVTKARADEGLNAARPAFMRSHGQHPRVSFTIADGSDSRALTLYVQREVNPIFGPGGSAETGRYQPVCALPCSVEMRPGPYVLALSEKAGPTVRLDETLSLRGGETLALTYDDRLWLRVGGWAFLLGGAVGGGTMLGYGQASDRPALLISGAVLGGVAIAAGLWLANLPNRARVER